MKLSGESSQQDQLVHVSLSLLGLLAHPRGLVVLQYQLVPEVHQVPDRETRSSLTERVSWQATVEDQNKSFLVQGDHLLQTRPSLRVPLQVPEDPSPPDGLLHLLLLEYQEIPVFPAHLEVHLVQLPPETQERLE